MPSIILGPRDAVMNQTDKGPVHIFVVPAMISSSFPRMSGSLLNEAFV